MARKKNRVKEREKLNSRFKLFAKAVSLIADLLAIVSAIKTLLK